jgi:Zn-dependent protease
MRGWSFPMGRWFGVDLRIHTFFLLLLAFCLLSTSVAGVATWRGFMLWFMLLMVVFVREIARVIVATYHGLQIRSILLLPIGGLFSYVNPESAERASNGTIQTVLAIVGPVASLLFAAVIAGMIVGSAPAVSLTAKPWITPTHLMRSTVWLSAMLALIHIVPASSGYAGTI